MIVLSPGLSEQTFVVKHLKLQVTIVYYFYPTETKEKQKMSNQNCFIDLCLQSCHLTSLHQGRISVKVNCTKTVPVVHGFKFYAFFNMTIGENKLEDKQGKLIVQSKV